MNSKKLFLFLFVYISSVFAQSPQIIQLLNQVNKDSLSLYLRQLSGDTSCTIGGQTYTIVSRHKYQPGNDKAAQFIYEKFQSFGLQVQYESFSATGKNVIATKQGVSDSQKYVVVCAHYDDMPSGTTAPGADDNASGTATVIELARVFSNYNFNYSIKFICFDEEEQGLIGSNYYATQARNRNDSIIAVINLDMTAYDFNNDGVVDVHSKNVANTPQIASEWINNVYQYGISLTPRLVASQPYSDHDSFLRKNYGAILVIEYDYEFNPRYHTVNDRFQYLNMDYAHKIAQVTAATAAEYAQIISSNSVTIVTNTGWNLLSIPIRPADGRKDRIFPNAVSNAYTYDAGYVVKDTLEIGRGYWLKFNSPQNNIIYGQVQNQLQINLNSGWNIIGSLNSPIDVNTITTNPPNIIQSLFYEYSNGYQPSNLLLPGKGYWVKASQNGLLNLSTSLVKNLSSESLNKLDFEYELLFTDASGNNSKLYLTESPIDASYYELPPIPPSSLFDVRFSDNTWITSINYEPIVVLNSPSYPIKIKLRSNLITQLLLTILQTSGKSEIILSSYEELIINEPISEIRFSKITVPNRFILYQNYPNPFNSATKIQFSIPENDIVTLKIYNIRGELIKEIFNGKLNKGFHFVYFDGSSLPSGVYIYELKTVKYKALKKMMLLK